MMFNKLGRRKNPHPNPLPQAMEGTMREGHRPSPTRILRIKKLNVIIASLQKFDVT